MTHKYHTKETDKEIKHPVTTELMAVTETVKKIIDGNIYSIKE